MFSTLAQFMTVNVGFRCLFRGPIETGIRNEFAVTDLSPDRLEQAMASTRPPDIPADEAQRCYLFRCAGDDELMAISTDPTARNITTRQCLTRWVPEGEVFVGVQEALPLSLNPEPVLRGLRIAGFYVWKAPSSPTSTTQ